MPRLFRLLCICLGVTIMVATQMHGVINGQHRIEHGLEFPGISYENAADLAHDHDHRRDGSLTDHRGNELPADDSLIIEAADEGGKTPFNHHHHGGGDIHIALSAPAHPSASGLFAALDLGPAPDAVPPGAILDAPIQPPRQNA